MDKTRQFNKKRCIRFTNSINMIKKTIQLAEGQKVFFASDFHYGHRNICRGTTSWKLEDHGGGSSVRDFDTLEEMNDKIVSDINDTVGQDDWLIFLGDWNFGGIKNVWEFRSRINCHNIVMVLGNHDEAIAANKVLPNCTKTVMNGELLISPIKNPSSDWYYEVNAQELFKGTYGRLQLVVKRHDGTKTTYECNHFPWVMYDKAHHGRIQIYGHVHGSYTHPGRALDVGIDNIFKLRGDYKPLDEEFIQQYMEGRTYEQFSHHNKLTN